MALFMDTHKLDGGVKAGDVAKAHLADLRTHGLVAGSINPVTGGE